MRIVVIKYELAYLWIYFKIIRRDVTFQCFENPFKMGFLKRCVLHGWAAGL